MKEEKNVKKKKKLKIVHVPLIYDDDFVRFKISDLHRSSRCGDFPKIRTRLK